MNNKLQQIFQSYLIGQVKPIAKNENVDAIINK